MMCKGVLASPCWLLFCPCLVLLLQCYHIIRYELDERNVNGLLISRGTRACTYWLLPLSLFDTTAAVLPYNQIKSEWNKMKGLLICKNVLACQRWMLPLSQSGVTATLLPVFPRRGLVFSVTGTTVYLQRNVLVWVLIKREFTECLLGDTLRAYWRILWVLIEVTISAY